MAVAVDAAGFDAAGSAVLGEVAAGIAAGIVDTVETADTVDTVDIDSARTAHTVHILLQYLHNIPAALHIGGMHSRG